MAFPKSVRREVPIRGLFAASAVFGRRSDPCCSTEDMAMRTYDFAPLTRSSIGFDRLFDLINTNAQRTTSQEPGFPPYDITRTGDDSYRITLAVAGYSPDEIAITAQQNLLSVAGNKADGDDHEYLHRGISAQ